MNNIFPNRRKVSPARKNGSHRFQFFFIRAAMFALILATLSLLGKIHARYIGEYDLTESSKFHWLMYYSALCYLISYSFGLPEQPNFSKRWKSALSASLATFFVFTGIQTVLARLVLPRFFLGLSIPAIFAVLLLWSSITARFVRKSANKERVLVIGEANEVCALIIDAKITALQPHTLARCLNIDEVVSPDLLPQICSSEKITLVVISEQASKIERIVTGAALAHSRGTRIRSASAFYNEWLGKIPIRDLSTSSLLFDIREIHHVGYARVSRMLDISIASLGLIALLVATPFVFVGNLLGNKGPLLYAQERIGKGQKAFRILKFRSMIPGSSVGEWTKKDDARITAFGKFLRLSHLDELPQVLNILRGDLSIVGPRPEQSHYVQQLAQTIPYYQSRHLVRPGLTGWAQVNYPYGADEIDAFEKLQYEFWYLRHQSMWLDLRIIARTFRHVLGFKGR
jgi:lipopolysaccharide/colanic/teichoic acid biosynthesis glycosyltransferase